ncbi:MAG TPA: TlpA disulfide reductase family protein [Ktedonobacterales bacterium]|jgi:peroxiredoxin
MGKREGKRFPWAPVAIAALVVATLALLLKALLTPAAGPASNQAPGPAAPLAGHYAPDATLVDLSGNQVALSSLRGKVVILNFWYAACEPCRLEMPALERYYQAHKGEGFVVLGANIVDDVQTTKDFTKAIGVSYPVFRDLGQRAYNTYQVGKTPSSFIIDRDGVVRKVVVGPLDTQTLDQTVSPLLKA